MSKGTERVEAKQKVEYIDLDLLTVDAATQEFNIAFAELLTSNLNLRQSKPVEFLLRGKKVVLTREAKQELVALMNQVSQKPKGCMYNLVHPGNGTYYILCDLIK